MVCTQNQAMPYEITKMKIRNIKFSAVIVLLTMLMAPGCNRHYSQEAIQRFASPEDQELAQQYIGYLRNRDFDEITKIADNSIQNENFRDTLLKMAELIPDEPPGSIKLIGANTHINSSQGQTVRNLTFEYEFSNKWILANVATKKTLTSFTIVGIGVLEQANSVEVLNKFRLSGKSPVHYATLLLSGVFVLLTLYAVVVCIRTKMARRKWLWVLFILFGIGKFTINWTTGAWHINPLAIQLLSAGAVAPLYGPWTVVVSVPLGAIVFLTRRKRLGFNNESDNKSGTPQLTLIHKVDPIYPEIAKFTGLSGTAELRVNTNKEGDVVGVRKVSGHPILVEVSMAAVRQWRYSQPLINGEPVSAEFDICVNFLSDGTVKVT